MEANEIKAVKDLVRSRYKDQNGEPFEMTDGQSEIYAAVFGRLYPRTHILTYTQYGKSETLAMAILDRITSFPEKFTIIAPTEKKTQIISGYLIDHIFDNKFTLGCFEAKGESLDRIRRERNKKHLTFKVGDGVGEVQMITAEGTRVKDIITALLGFGSPNVVLDESPILSEEHYSGVLRMLGGHKDNMLIELGNAINRGHFYKAGKDNSYHHILIDYLQGVKENRQTKEYFDEMARKMPPQIFSSLYECKFPQVEQIDSKGYSPLLTEQEIENSYFDLNLFGELRMGIDIAGEGSNWTTMTIRGENGARLVFKEHTGDTMSIITHAQEIAKTYKIPFDDKHILLDKGGIGIGVCDRLNEMFTGTFGINFGGKPEEDQNAMLFINRRAQMYWRTAEWIRRGGKLSPKNSFNDLIDIKYKVQSDKKIKIKSKAEMIQEGIGSPDCADSLALTFAITPTYFKPFKQAEWQPSTAFGI